MKKNRDVTDKGDERNKYGVNFTKILNESILSCSTRSIFTDLAKNIKVQMILSGL